MFSELDLIRKYKFSGEDLTLIDVGANRGGFSLPFARRGWNIYAFEPEKSNYSIFKATLARYKNVHVYPYAISNAENNNAPFFVSKVHYGIHSLKPFHKTHKYAYGVSTHRLDKFLKEKKVSSVSLLKVDIEGADYFALKGFDFKRIKPEVVMVEYMDSRSIPGFGYSHKDMIKLMKSNNYVVYISRWKKVKEYAIEGHTSEPHEWISCSKYNNQKVKNDEWGNLIFVRKEKAKYFGELLRNYLRDLNKRNDSFSSLNLTISKIKNNLLDLTHKMKLSSRRNIALAFIILIHRNLLMINNNLGINKILSFVRLERFRNKYSGKRCFIIGNGPSLNKTDLSLLRNEYTFGLNRIYINFKNMGYRTSFLVSVNRTLIDQCVTEIDSIDLPVFLPESSRKNFNKKENKYFMKSVSGPLFSSDITNGVWEGSTVTFVAMQIAYFMGFTEVYLVGVDHSFVTKGDPHKTVYQKDDDPNHFSSSYFKNMKWQLPDLETSEIAYRIAKYCYEQNGRIIYDSTVSGKLHVFKKIKLENLFK